MTLLEGVKPQTFFVLSQPAALSNSCAVKGCPSEGGSCTAAPNLSTFAPRQATFAAHSSRLTTSGLRGLICTRSDNHHQPPSSNLLLGGMLGGMGRATQPPFQGLFQLPHLSHLLPPFQLSHCPHWLTLSRRLAMCPELPLLPEPWPLPPSQACATASRAAAATHSSSSLLLALSLIAMLSELVRCLLVSL